MLIPFFSFFFLSVEGNFINPINSTYQKPMANMFIGQCYSFFSEQEG